jgi:HPt (histidine-containing phosphotransfer) domain-containing protein
LKKWSTVVNVVPRPWSASPRRDEATRGFSRIFGNLQEIAGSNPEVMLEIVALFLSEATTRLVKIRQAVLNGDVQALEQPLEHLRVGSGYLGAQALTRLCYALGDAVSAKRRADALALYAKLANEFENVRLVLEVDGNRLLFQGRF